LKQSFPGCDAKSTSLRIRAFWLAIIDVVDVIDVDPVFEIFPPFLFKTNPAFLTFFVSVAHDPSILWRSRKSARGAILDARHEHRKYRSDAARKKP
jgi:hypothetical protein